MTALTTTQTLPLTISFRQRSLTIAASLLITLTVVAANLEIAQGYAMQAHTQMAQTGQQARG